MSAAAAVSGSGAGSSIGPGPVDFALDRTDRVEALFAPVGSMSRAMLAVLAGSLALHLVLVATAIVTSRTPPAIPESRETPVEVVQEVPKAEPKETPKTEPPKPPPPPKIEKTKAEAPKAEPRKLQAQSIQPPKSDTQNVQAARVEAPKPAAPKPAAPKSVAKSESMKAVTGEREALLKELAALRAQEAKLESRETPNLGMGPLPDSFQAVALPASTEAAGEAMGYKEIVFSQLAKAKGLDERMGLPGTAGVRFSVDAAGGLVDVEIVHPSGVAALDREAIDIVRRAAPFPVPPPGAQRNFVANVNFVAQDKP